MEIQGKNIFGVFISTMANDPAGHLFNNYMYNTKGISNALKKLEYNTYGEDLKLILLQFGVNTPDILIKNLKEIENYRIKEKSIGINIFINDNNFFSKTDKERLDFIKQTIFQKIELLSYKIKKKKLDTKIELLKQDLIKVLS